MRSLVATVRDDNCFSSPVAGKSKSAIAIISAVAGAGKSAVAAGLVEALSRRQKVVRAVAVLARHGGEGLYGNIAGRGIPRRSLEEIEDSLTHGGVGPEVVVIDIPSGDASQHERLTRLVNQLIIVSTADAAGIVETYTLLKWLHGAECDADIALLVNRAPNVAAGRQAAQRIIRAAQTFLRMKIIDVGVVTEAADIGRTAIDCRPNPGVLSRPTTDDAMRAVCGRIARNLCGLPRFRKFWNQLAAVFL